MILFSRWEHGSKKIKISSEGYEVENQFFPTWKKLCHYIYGKPCHISKSSYFKQNNKFEKELKFRKELFLDLEKELEELNALLLSKKGVDLDKFYLDVRKIILSGFSKKIPTEDLDDIIQEIFKGLLIRNNGTCSFDRTKSSMSSYVYMVSNCIIANYYQKEKKHPPFELLQEESSSIKEKQRETLVQDQLEKFIFTQMEQNKLNKSIWKYLLQGYKISEISKKMNLPASKISKVSKELKTLCASWAKQEGMDSFLPMKFQN